MKMRKVIAVALACALMSSQLLPAFSAVESQALPEGTRIYMVTDKEVTSKRGEWDVGTVVPCRVWRDVEYEGKVFIKSGTSAACRIDKIKRRNMGGSEGKISIAGIDTRSVDGQNVMLSGGYNKEGSGRKAVVWTVGLLLLWPVLFVPGGQAELPPGTVFDVTTVNDLRLKPDASEVVAPRRVNLSGLVGGLSAEVMLDDLLQQSKPEVLRVRVSKEAPFPSSLSVDSVNGKSIDPIAVKLLNPTEVDGNVEAVGEIKLKPLAKHFQKGINRFEVAFQESGERRGTEVILDVQM